MTTRKDGLTVVQTCHENDMPKDGQTLLIEDIYGNKFFGYRKDGTFRSMRGTVVHAEAFHGLPLPDQMRRR